MTKVSSHFLRLVNKINSSIGQDPDSKTLIGVLDIYGFETFKTNRCLTGTHFCCTLKHLYHIQLRRSDLNIWCVIHYMIDEMMHVKCQHIFTSRPGKVDPEDPNWDMKWCPEGWNHTRNYPNKSRWKLTRNELDLILTYYLKLPQPILTPIESTWI